MATYAFTQLVPIALAEDELAVQSLARAMLSDVAPDETLDWSTLRLTFEDATYVEAWSEEGGAVVGTNVARMVIPDARPTAKLLRAEVDTAAWHCICGSGDDAEWHSMLCAGSNTPDAVFYGDA